MGDIIAGFVSDFVAGMLVEGTGRAILTIVAPGRPHGRAAAILTGLAFWTILAALTFLLAWGILLA